MFIEVAIQSGAVVALCSCGAKYRKSMKDIFNGKIKKEQINSVLRTLIVGSVVVIVCGAFLFACPYLGIGLEDKLGEIIMKVIGGFFMAVGVLLFPFTLFVVRREDRFPRLSRMLLKPYVFEEHKDNQNEASGQNNANE